MWSGALMGLLGACLLVLLGGPDNVYAIGLALLLPGLSFLVRPPAWGLGPAMDRAVILFLVVLLAAFIPQFYWPNADWRAGATALGLDLPAVLSVQPRISLEVWLQVAAGCAWLYAAYSWPLNDNGRRWFFFSFSVAFAGFALAVLWGYVTGIRYPGSGSLESFSFFPQWTQTAGFLAVGGVVSFVYAMRDSQSRAVAPLMGFFASALCLAALLFPVSPFGLGLYIGGLALWYLWRIRSRPKPGRIVKYYLPLALLMLAFHGFIGGSDGRADAPRMDLYGDAAKMIAEAPLTGVGLGNFESLIPQYRSSESVAEIPEMPRSSVLRLVAEAGLLGLVAAVGLVAAYLRLWKAHFSRRGVGLRLAALFGVLLFGLHALLDLSGHRLGPVYLAILLVAVSLPQPQASGLRFRRHWRVAGALLVFIGFLWLFSGLVRIPAHSIVSIEERKNQLEEAARLEEAESGLKAVEGWLRLRPLDWKAYHWQGEFKLLRTGDVEAAAPAFQRARFVEPNRGLVPYEEGLAWLPYSGERTAAAWLEALKRGMPEAEAAFTEMLDAAEERRDLMTALAEVSRLDPRYRVLYFERLSGRRLMEEIDRDLEKSASLAHFSLAQRTRVLERWIREGDVPEAVAFIDEHRERLDRVWWLQSISEMKRANFAAAVELIRRNLDVPVLPELELEPNGLVRTKREFAVDSGDDSKGLLLFQFYFEAGDYAEALSVCELLRESGELPIRLHYWRAETLYRIGDFVESWFAFEAYIELLEEK